MRLLKIAAYAAVVSLAFGAPARAADHHGFYVGLEGGWVKVEDTSLPSLGYENLVFEDKLGKDAYAALATAGYAFEGNWRLEAEVGYRRNALDKVDVSIGPNAALGLYPLEDGHLREVTGFVNAIYDIRLGNRLLLDLGAGVGVDNVALKIPDPDGAGLMRAVDVDNSVLAGQLLAGLTYRLSPHWDLDLNYRYLWAADVTLTGQVCGSSFAIAFVVVPPVTCVPQDDSLAMTKHTVTIGLRYGFDSPEQPAPPQSPPPVIPPPMTKQFVIFFGFNKCNITAEADGVLTEAAAAARAGNITRIKIVGHTDTVGSASRNQKLSECRANAAKASLVAKGISAEAIVAEGHGENDLLLQTGDGVKEPQNRRATIDLQ
jgi:outer membrane protein OmpA-like peptidoglycan-associated protein